MRNCDNFKRYPVHNHDHEVEKVCGIDLCILIARYQAPKRKVDEIPQAQEKRREALHYFQ
nr:helix-turn-helix domain-containing protein [Bartonella washoeensis]